MDSLAVTEKPPASQETVPVNVPMSIAEFYCWAPPADDVEETRRELAREFTEWSIIVGDRDRWWAIRRPVLDRSGWVDADTPELLRDKLREVGP